MPDDPEVVRLKIACNVLRARVTGIDDLCGTGDFANPLLVPVAASMSAQHPKFERGGRSESLEHTLLDLICLMVETRAGDALLTSDRQSLGAAMYDRLTTHMQGHSLSIGAEC